MGLINKTRQQFSIKNEFNELNFAHLRLSELSMNLLFLLITQIDSKNDEDLNTYRITIKNLEEILGKKRINKSTIEKSREELFTNTFMEDPRDTLASFSIFSIFTIDGNLLELKINDAMKNFFIQINANTPYFKGYLVEYISLKNSNTKNLYLLLRQLLNRRYNKQYTVEELRTELGFNENEYTKFKDFNRKVLKSSIESINKFTSLNVKSVYIRHSRDVERVEFEISETKKTRAIKSTIMSAADQRVMNWANGIVDENEPEDPVLALARKWCEEDTSIMDVEIIHSKIK